MADAAGICGFWSGIWPGSAGWACRKTSSDIVVVDACDRALVAHAAGDIDAIVHAVNLPYPQWDPAMRRITAAAIEGAHASGARLVFPGNVYAFGRQDARPLHEEAERRHDTVKSRLCADLESAIETLGHKGTASVLILRAGNRSIGAGSHPAGSAGRYGHLFPALAQGVTSMPRPVCRAGSPAGPWHR